MKNPFSYFTKTELFIWITSVILILSSFFLFDSKNYLTLIASLTGATALILCAKGNPIGLIFIIFFSALYGIISLRSAYYGEMITYLGMSAPMSIIALVAWIKNPSKKGKSEVKVGKLNKKDVFYLIVFTALVTCAFYFILRALNTAELIPSTLSVTTSFTAVYLTYKRSPFFSLAYAMNDLVLIVLWILATQTDASNASVIICFITFLANDLYGFINWLNIKKRQSKE